MATYYIDPISGNDSNDGLSEATPCASMDHVVLNLLGKALSVDGTMYEFASYTSPENVAHVINLMRGTILSRGFHVEGLSRSLSSYTSYHTLTIQGANNAMLLVNTAGTAAFHLHSSGGNYSSSNYVKSTAGLTLRNVRCFANRDVFCRQTGVFYSYVLPGNYAAISAVSFDNVVVRGCDTLLLHDSIPMYDAAGEVQLVRNVLTEAAPVSSDYTTRVLISIVKSIIAEPSKTQEVGSYTYAPTPAAIMAGEGAFLPQPSYISAITPGLVVTDYNFSPSAARSFLGGPGVVASAWVDDASYPHGIANIASSQITIATGLSARVLSPVQVFPEGISFSTTAVSSIEDEGAKDVLDSTPADTTRTIDVRVSDTPFTQLDVSPAWIAIPRNSSHQLLTGKYVQFRITLTTEGA